MELQLRLQREEEERIAAEIKRAGRTGSGHCITREDSLLIPTTPLDQLSLSYTDITTLIYLP